MTDLTGKEIRIILNELRRGIKERNWNTVEYVEGLLNMHTIDDVLKEE